MTEYMCPKNIQDMFETDNENDKFIGRKKAADWYSSLNLVLGDRIYLPEIGWMEKTRVIINATKL